MDRPLEMPKEKAVARQRSRGWIPWVIFLLVVAAVGAYFWQRPQSGHGPSAYGQRSAQPMSIQAATVQKGDIDVTLDALGTVTSLATVTVKSQISGQLLQVDFKEGQDYFPTESDNFFVGNSFPSCGINFTAQEIMGQSKENQ